MTGKATSNGIQLLSLKLVFLLNDKLKVKETKIFVVISREIRVNVLNCIILKLETFHTERVIVLSWHCLWLASARQNLRHSFDDRRPNYYSVAFVLKV